MTVLPQEHLGTLPSYRGLCVQQTYCYLTIPTTTGTALLATL